MAMAARLQRNRPRQCRQLLPQSAGIPSALDRAIGRFGGGDLVCPRKEGRGARESGKVNRGELFGTKLPRYMLGEPGRWLCWAGLINLFLFIFSHLAFLVLFQESPLCGSEAEYSVDPHHPGPPTSTAFTAFIIDPPR